MLNDQENQSSKKEVEISFQNEDKNENDGDAINNNSFGGFATKNENNLENSFS